jgi:hypothetical protein
MPTITVLRGDITTSQVAEVLRNGLGSAQLARAQVKITHSGDQTVLHVSSGGISPLIRLANRLWITQKTFRVLQAAPGLR